MKLGEFLSSDKARSAELRSMGVPPEEWANMVVYVEPPFTKDSRMEILSWAEVKRLETPVGFEEFDSIGDLEEWAESFEYRPDPCQSLIDYVADLIGDIK